MRELIVRDDRELRRVEHAISTIEGGKNAGKLGKQCLLAALMNERDELLRGLGRRPGRRPAAGPSRFGNDRAAPRAA